MDLVCQGVQHRQVVLDDEHVPGLAELLYHLGHHQALVDVQVRRGFVEEVHISLPDDGGRDGQPLQLATRERLQFLIHHGPYAQLLHRLVHHATFVHLLQQLADLTLEQLG